MKKKLLFIAPVFDVGGSERYLLELINVIDPNDYEITLYVASNHTEMINSLPSYIRIIIENKDYHFFRNPKIILYSFLSKAFGLFKLSKLKSRINENEERYLKELKLLLPAKKHFKNEFFDLIIINLMYSRAEIVKYISSDNKILIYQMSNDNHHQNMTSLLPYIGKIVAVSPGVKEMLISKYPEHSNKVQVISNYINAESIIKQASAPLDIDIPSNRIVLCTCGRISKEKGVDLAIDAARILKEKNIEFCWLFIGDGNEMERMKGLVKRYQLEEYVMLIGLKENPYPYISVCDIYVQPSYEDAQPRAIKEALILGIPVVSTRTVGAISLLDNGKKGIITDISSEALSCGIIVMMNDSEKYKYNKEDSSLEKKEFVSKWNNIIK